MANEMVSIFGKCTSEEVKQKISDKINDIDCEKFEPKQRLARPASSLLGGRFNSRKAISIKRAVSQRQTLSQAGDEFTRTLDSIDELSEKSLGRKACPSTSLKRKKQILSFRSPSSKSVLQNQLPLTERKHKVIKSIGKQDKIDPSQKTVQILKKIVKQMKPETMQKKEAALIKVAKIEHRVHSALSQRQERRETDHLQLSGRKFRSNDSKRFDLNYLSPVVRDNFPQQLTQSHYSGRK